MRNIYGLKSDGKLFSSEVFYDAALAHRSFGMTDGFAEGDEGKEFVFLKRDFFFGEVRGVWQVGEVRGDRELWEIGEVREVRGDREARGVGGSGNGEFADE